MARPRQRPDSENNQPNDETPTKPEGSGSRGGRRSTPADRTQTSSPGSSKTTPAKPATAADDPFAIASAGGFEAPKDGRPRTDDDLGEFEDDVDARLFEWDTERAGAAVRLGGHVLHASDRMGHVEGGEELWKATEQDAREIGEPLARILNRYDATRRLAGKVDEGELVAAMYGYAKRNLRLRGALVRRARAETDVPRVGADAFDDMAGDRQPPVQEYRVEREPQPVVEQPAGDEDPTQPEVFAFDPWAAR